MILYAVRNPFRSVGRLYMPGEIITEEDFLDPMKLRLGKVKVSEGYLLPLDSEKANWKDDALRLDARLGNSNVAELAELIFTPHPGTEEVAAKPKIQPLKIKK